LPPEFVNKFVSKSPIDRKHSIGSNQPLAVSLFLFNPKVKKIDIGELYIHVSNALAECRTIIAGISLIGL